MTDCRLFNAHPLNREARGILKELSLPLDRKSQLAAVQLMLWFLEQDPGMSLPEWVIVPWEDRSRDGEEMTQWLVRQERDNPRRLMRLLTRTDSGDPYQIDLSGTPEEAAATLLEELISSMQAEQPLTESEETAAS